MKLKGDLGARLACTLDRAHYGEVRAPDPVVVEEDERGSEMEVLFYLPDGAAAVEWTKKLDADKFKFLKATKNPDGVFFVQRGGDRVDAHVIECKKTVAQDEW